ncbi:UBP-type zinc finger domain-containing protein [Sphaerisporangium corydalis]|uniref:UBP-type zinc finger domain-containing protein n=1 Tax=Sphaerisporangium corydalis TaxID=1441875 RepID=A0ABV9ERC7_9ACTN|nr:UBP-type zinc finger domain-containing protein [Sphaerisporangium corydalis]
MTTRIGSLNGQTPRCGHVSAVSVAGPGAPECKQCLVLGLDWTALMACLTCGWVACSNDSPGCHAREHYEESDHPVAARLNSEPPWRWCYVHGRPV